MWLPVSFWVKNLLPLNDLKMTFIDLFLEWFTCHRYQTHQKIEMEVIMFLLTHPTVQHRSINVLISSLIIWSLQIIPFVFVKHHVLLQGKSRTVSFSDPGSNLADDMIF